MRGNAGGWTPCAGAGARSSKLRTSASRSRYGAAVALGIACYCDCVESYATIELHNLRDTYEADSGYSFTGNYLSAAVHDGCDANVVGLLTAERGVCRVVVHTDTSSVDIDFHVYMSFVIVE